MHAEHYYKVIYPIQDKVIQVFRDTPFYLTGGTALSRGYYNHRFSDDLDYFVNYLSNFHMLAEVQVKKLQDIFPIVDVDYKGDYFYRLYVAERQLKIEIVNDVPAHIGEKLNHPIIGIIDSRENILANKITAIVDRCMPKDIADIYFLLKDGLSLKQALLDAHSKAAGIAPLYIAKIFSEYDYCLLDSEIRWIRPVASPNIAEYLREISMRIVRGSL